MSGVMPTADVVSMDLSALWGAVEKAWEDGIVTDREKRGVRGRYKVLQRKTRSHSLLQRVGFSVARIGRLDKNLVTMLRSLCQQEEDAIRQLEAEAARFEGAEHAMAEVEGTRSSHMNEAIEKAASRVKLEAAVEKEVTLLRA